MRNHDTKSEEWVIGAILNDPENFERARATLSSSDFQSISHRKIFSTFERLDREGTPLDLTTIAALLKPEEIDLARFLREDTPTDRTIDYWIRVVKRVSLESQLKEAVQSDDLDPKRIEAIAFEINGLGSASPSLYRPINEIQRLSEDPGLLIKSGLRDVDAHIPIRPGILLTISGQSGLGKTSLGNQFAHYICKTRPTGIVSLEMTGAEIRAKFEKSFGTIPEKNLFVADPPSLSSLGLKHILIRMKAEQAVEVVMIDYLQLLREREDFRSRALEVSHIVRKIKEFAKELKMGVILISTLNRGVGEGERPSLGSLKESGDIEYASDAVLFIYQPEGKKYKVLIIAKNRWGRIGDIKILWDGSRTRFADYRDEEDITAAAQQGLYEGDEDGSY